INDGHSRTIPRFLEYPPFPFRQRPQYDRTPSCPALSPTTPVERLPWDAKGDGRAATTRLRDPRQPAVALSDLVLPCPWRDRRHTGWCRPESRAPVSSLTGLAQLAPMRILHVIPTYPPCVGGSERMLQAVSERLVARGHAVTVLTLDCATQRDFTSRTGAGLQSCDLLNGVKIIRVSPNGGRLLRAVQWWLRRRGGWRST